MKSTMALGLFLITIVALLAGGGACGGGEKEPSSPLPEQNLPPVFEGLDSAAAIDGAYLLSWTAASDDTTPSDRITYHVFASADPSITSFDLASPLLTVTGTTSAGISDLPPGGRFYFIVRACDAQGACEQNAVRQTERTFGLKTAPNFRDLGGYVNAEGKQIQWNRVFRSGELSDLDDRELAIVNGFRFGRIMDLREPAEIARDGADRTYSGNEAIYDLLGFNVGDPYLLAAPVDPANPLSQLLWDVRQVDYPNWYVNVLESNRDGIRRAFERFADPLQYPILFHCTQGKDRAGVVSALLLMLLDVPEDEILEDYMLTCRLTAGDIEKKLDLIASILPSLSAAPQGITAEDWRPMLSCHEEAMSNMLAHVRLEYGGIEGFLESIGVTIAQQEAIRDVLLSE